MARNDQRRLAADARRIAGSDGDERKATEQIRDALRQNYDRGREQGREEMRAEMRTLDPRRALLGSAADHLETMGLRLSAIPNSSVELRACREAAAILQDASEAIEREPEPESEAESPPQKPKSRAKASA